MDQTASNQKFESWAVVELFGHNRIAGLVTEETIGGCAFLRVDVPSVDGESTQFTKYFGNGAIYAMNVTTKEDVLKIVAHLYPPPPVPRVSEQRTLTTSRDDDDFSDADDQAEIEF